MTLLFHWITVSYRQTFAMSKVFSFPLDYDDLEGAASLRYICTDGGVNARKRAQNATRDSKCLKSCAVASSDFISKTMVPFTQLPHNLARILK